MSALSTRPAALAAAVDVRELPEPPPELLPDTFAERLYLSVSPLALADQQNAWSLLILCNAIGRMYQLVELLVRDSPDGPGWSALVDVNRSPPEALDWLAQLVGVRLLPDSTDAEKRLRIVSTDGFRRGTVEAIRAAAQATLTGTQTVTITERDGDPYVFTVATLAGETPNIPATRAAVLAAKPAGLVVNFTGGAAAQTWDALHAGYATWDAVRARYPNWNAALLNAPPAAEEEEA
jgi:Phage tail protein (Tail_P2_I)